MGESSRGEEQTWLKSLNPFVVKQAGIIVRLLEEEDLRVQEAVEM